MSKKTKKGIPGQPRYYETVIVIDSLLGEEGIKTILDKIKEILAQKNARILAVDEWGKKKLAYPIKKKTYGYYISIEFEAYGDVNASLLEYYRITESILRFAVMLVDARLRKQRISEKTSMKEPSLEDIAQLNV